MIDMQYIKTEYRKNTVLTEIRRGLRYVFLIGSMIKDGKRVLKAESFYSHILKEKDNNILFYRRSV